MPDSSGRPTIKEIRQDGAIPWTSQVVDDSNYGVKRVLSDVLDEVDTRINNVDLKLGIVIDDEMYVSTLGSDEEGDGTIEYPFATIAKCFERIPDSVPDNTSISIKVANGQYNKFVGSIGNKIQNGQILIDGYQGSVDVITGPFTVSSLSYESFTGCTFTVSGASFPDDGLRDLDNNPLWIKMLSGNYTGNTFPIFKNTVDTITVLDKDLGIEDGDQFKIVRPGVRIFTNNEIILSPQSASGKAVLGLYNLSINSSYYPDSSHSAAVKISGGNVDLHLVNIRSDASKCYALSCNASSINSEDLYDKTKLSYYSEDSGVFDPFYWGFTYHANSMLGASFKQGVSVSVTQGGRSAGGVYTSTNISGLCTRTEVTVQGNTVNFYWCAVGRMHIQQSNTFSDIRVMMFYPWSEYCVLVSDNTVASVAYIKTMHETPFQQILKVENGSVLNDLSGLVSAVVNDYVVTVEANCQMNLLSKPSIHGSVADIFFTRGQKDALWPNAGYSANDSENSYVSVHGSVASTNRDTDGFIDIRKSGSFVVPVGTASGFYDIYIDNVIADMSGPPYESINYNNTEIILIDAAAGDSLHSVHSGFLTHTHSLKNISDTLLPHTGCAYIDTVAGIDPLVNGRLYFRVSWNTTERLDNITLYYTAVVRGHISKVVTV